MNKITLLITTALASLTLSQGSLFAAAPATTDARTKPYPVSIVEPNRLPRDYENALVSLKLTIDAQGVPHNVRPAEWIPSAVAERLVSAVSQWRFEPARVNGRAVPTTAILPLKLQQPRGV